MCVRVCVRVCVRAHVHVCDTTTRYSCVVPLLLTCAGLGLCATYVV